jgi:phosphoribosylformylglycinamidine synthase PurS subunit
MMRAEFTSAIEGENMYLAKVYIRLKKGLLDPQGKAIEGAIASMGFAGIDNVTVGKLVDIKLKAKDKADAGKKIEMICKKLLANPNIEVSSYDLEEIK